MGRAGAGGHSGGHSSGGHTGARSSGGHRVGSGGGHTRAGAGRSGSGHSEPSRRGFGGSYGFGGPGGPPPPRRGFGRSYGPGGPGGPPPPPPHRYHRRYYGGGGYRSGGCSGIFSSIVAAFIVLIIVVVVLLQSCVGGESKIPKSTYDREKVNTGVAFQNDCIVDELGWFDNISKTESRLQNFYKETGVQPYVVLKAYDASLTTDNEKEAYANQWYEENIDNEGTFLFMYFAEKDTDNDVGYMCYVNGKQITPVMDAEAIDIFWAYIDEKWCSDASTDDMIVDTFNATAKRIMAKTTSTTNINKFLIIGIVIIILAVVGRRKIKPKTEM